ncbi:MAG: ABC transporter substrate-binding protein, partial [Spirochaetes bacterium]|nr:ABC transporter substrate-binding protein [Spirochaetota bacterium]
DTQAMLKQKLYYFWMESDVPKLTAWIPTNDENENIYILKRNPYYWKVDKESNQLPYIDEIHYYRVEDTSAYTLKAIAGEIDFQFRSIKTEDYTLFKENEKRGDYKVYQWQNAGNKFIVFNPTIEDPVLSDLYQNPEFRKAVSLALNRDEILEITEARAINKQASFVADSPHYSKSWEKAYAMYDKEKANAMLDEIGLKWAADKKFRLRSDGSVLEIVLMHRLTTQADLAMVELIVKYMSDIGLKVLAKQVDRTYLEKLRDTNQLSMIINEGFQELNLLIDNKPYVPTRDEEAHWGLFGKYVESGGKEGIKPAGDYSLLVEYWNNLMEAPMGPEQDKWANMIVDLHEKNIWIIGIYSQGPKLAILNNKIRNVPERVLDADILRTPGNAKPWQFYYSN